MESVQREILSVLLERVLANGLISQSTYRKAVDLIHSMADIPVFIADTTAIEAGENTL